MQIVMGARVTPTGADDELTRCNPQSAIRNPKFTWHLIINSTSL
jgi:hypothetical protein